ncbi:MAG: asparaginase [Chloroflexi bacterium]|nr:asparaginase [Chloroflexota bacterium]
MTRVHIIATGGTIAMAYDENTSRFMPALSGADFLQRLLSEAGPGLPLTSEEYGPLPSSHFTVEHLWGLRERVAAALAEPDVDGVVLTHGTDTLEETAYLLDLTVPGDKPIVLTGAMRVASEPGYEGIANLLAAVRVAISAEARGLGALVVMNDEVHAARDVTKMHSQSIDAFQSPFWGPLGRVEPDRIVITRRVQRELLACTRLEPSVYLLKLAMGMDAELLRHAVVLGARGVVIESFGGGRVPPWWLQAIEEAIAHGVAIVITTRCPAGRIYDQYGYVGAYHDLIGAGCIFAEGLNGPKARLRLMVALGVARDLQETKRLFTGQGQRTPSDALMHK